MSPAQIARSMSEAEIAALLSTEGATPGSLFSHNLIGAVVELFNKGLLGMRPTPLGLSVRAAILASEGEG